jgi:pyridoxal phosphate enzyme (YggS family)
MNLKDNLEEVIQNIEKARLSVSKHHIVKLIAVSKYSNTKNISKLYKLGQRAFGENQVQQLEVRVNELQNLPLEWHFIGRLQKNKINKLISIKPYLIQSIDSLELALEIDKRLNGEKLNGLLQINSSNEDSKAGVSLDMAKDIYQEIEERCSNINLKGIMTIGAINKNLTQKSFEETYKIYESINNASICSMGMSGDYQLAIRCGSNLVRIGNSIFGSNNG